MGHAVDYITVSKRSEIMKAADEYAFYNTDRGENPSGTYHGNMHIHDRPICENYDDALSRLTEWDTGWYSDHAVQFKDKTSLKPTKQMEDVDKRLSETQKKRKEFIESHMPNRVKAEFIGCRHCGSKIAKSHLRGIYCPVCRKDIRPQSTIDREKGYDAKIAELRKVYSDLEKKQDGKCPVKWLVKVEVHC